jgi:transposase
MLSRAMDCHNVRPIRWKSPPWDRNSVEWRNIDRNLPENHLARRIDHLVEGLDLTGLQRRYAGRGSPPFPPELLLRLVLLESWRGELRPIQWHRDCLDCESVKWLIFGLTPSASALYLFRKRCAPTIDGLNRQILEIARAEGFLSPDNASFDGTFVSARGSRSRLVKAKKLDQRLDQLDTAITEDLTLAEADNAPCLVDDAGTLSSAETEPLVRTSSPAPHTAESLSSRADSSATVSMDSPPDRPAQPPATTNKKPPYWMAKTPKGRFNQRMRYQRAQEVLKRKRQSRQRELSRTAKSRRQPVQNCKICPTEPEAGLGFDKLKTYRPLYNVQMACAHASWYIIGYDVIVEITDSGQFGPLADRVKELCGNRPARVAADEKYAGQVDLALAHKLGIELYAPTEATKQADGSHKKPNKGMIPKHKFVWVPEQATYRCPQGHFLKFVGSSKQSRQGGETLEVTQYRCPPAHCQACPLQAKCTRNPERGRIVKRNEHDDLTEELRERMGRPESQDFYARRKQTIEPTFGGLKEHRGLRQFRGFGLIGARTQVAILVLAYNGLKLLKAHARAREQSVAGNDQVA